MCRIICCVVNASVEVEEIFGSDEHKNVNTK